jgi:hypothetical protein
MMWLDKEMIGANIYIFPYHLTNQPLDLWTYVDPKKLMVNLLNL